MAFGEFIFKYAHLYPMLKTVFIDISKIAISQIDNNAAAADVVAAAKKYVRILSEMACKNINIDPLG